MPSDGQQLAVGERASVALRVALALAQVARPGDGAAQLQPEPRLAVREPARLPGGRHAVGRRDGHREQLVRLDADRARPARVRPLADHGPGAAHVRSHGRAAVCRGGVQGVVVRVLARQARAQGELPLAAQTAVVRLGLVDREPLLQQQQLEQQAEVGDDDHDDEQPLVLVRRAHGESEQARDDEQPAGGENALEGGRVAVVALLGNLRADRGEHERSGRRHGRRGMRGNCLLKKS